MPRALKVCSTPSCPELTEQGRCAGCRSDAERERGSASQRGYGSAHRERFRKAVLARDPICTAEKGCTEPSTDADHHPIDRRELERRGLDPNDPKYGRGLCSLHHKQATGHAQPGGWNAR